MNSLFISSVLNDDMNASVQKYKLCLLGMLSLAFDDAETAVQFSFTVIDCLLIEGRHIGLPYNLF